MENITLIMEKYLNNFPTEKELLNDFLIFLEENKNIFDRKNFYGHIVANSLILNPKNEVLTIFHNKLQMYLQPGGHIELEDNSITNAAKRELQEETGIMNIKIHPWHIENTIPIFIEPHLIPENIKKNEGKHFHYDFMYIFIASNDKVKLQIEEVSDYKWTLIDKILKETPNSFLSKSLTKMQKLNII